VSRRNRATWHCEEAGKALAPARELLQKHGVPFAVHIELGERAATIDRVAQRLRVSQIVMGTARKNSLTRLIEDSVTSKVLQLARVPVEVIVGESVSKLEQMIVPAGVGAVVVFLLAATD
jgi:nucleotide-binding universal stress UspA family protein